MGGYLDWFGLRGDPEDGFESKARTFFGAGANSLPEEFYQEFCPEGFCCCEYVCMARLSRGFQLT